MKEHKKFVHINKSPITNIQIGDRLESRIDHTISVVLDVDEENWKILVSRIRFGKPEELKAWYSINDFVVGAWLVE